MIIDTLANAHLYFSLHGGFEPAFRFLRRADLGELAVAAYEIDARRLYASIQRQQGRRESEAPLEAHRGYIDIQFLIDGDERIGWSPRGACTQLAREYDPEADVELFADRPRCFARLEPGTFAVFFPDDAHAPLISESALHKCVVKVKI